MNMKLLSLTPLCLLLFFMAMGHTQTTEPTRLWVDRLPDGVEHVTSNTTEPTRLWVVRMPDGVEHITNNPETDFPEAISKYPFRPFLRVFTTRDGVKKLACATEIPTYTDIEVIIFESMYIDPIRKFWENGVFGVSWEGLLIFLEWPELLATLGISNAQLQEIKKARANAFGNVDKCPELQEKWREIQELKQAFGCLTRPFLESDSLHNIDEQTMNKLFDIQERIETLSLNVIVGAAEAALTSEQIHKINEIYVATMGKSSLISPRAFEALDLSDTQRQAVKQIEIELKSEFEKYLECSLEKRMILYKKLFDEFARSDRDFLLNEVVERLMAEDPEFRIIRTEIQTLNEAFAMKFRMKMFDVLTDKQWKQHQELIDNPPEHALVFLNMLRSRLYCVFVSMTSKGH